MARLDPYMDESDVGRFHVAFEKMLKEHLSALIKKKQQELFAEVKAHIDNWVATVALNLVRVVTMERFGDEFRISISTKDLKTPND